MRPTLLLSVLCVLPLSPGAFAQDDQGGAPETTPPVKAADEPDALPPANAPVPTPVASDDEELPDTASAAVRAAFEPLARAQAPLVVTLKSQVTIKDGDEYKVEERTILGTLVAQDGIILTKASEVGPAVTVTFSDGAELEGWTAARDEAHDLALVRVERGGLPVALFDVDASSADALAAGRFLAAIGANGEVVGAGVVGTPARAIKQHERGYLGVNTEDVEGGGVKVTKVLDGTPAKDAGIKTGDVLLSIEGEEIVGSDGLRALLRKRQPGDTVTFGIQRGEEDQELPVELGAPDTGDMKGGHVAFQLDISERSKGFPSAHQFDADVQPQHCGGPVFDARERLVGFTAARMDRTGTLVIPARVVVARLEQLIPRARAAESPVPEALALAALEAEERKSRPADPDNPTATSAPERVISAGPNVVLFVIDDAPWADFGPRLAPDLRLPALGELSSAGVRCTDALAASSYGSPARAALLTGRYPQRFGHQNELRAPDQGLDPAQATLPELLARVGYTCAAFGKWDLGQVASAHPLQRGFVEHFGFLAGPRPLGPLDAAAASTATRLMRGSEPVEESGPLAARLAEEAAAFIAAHGGEEEPMFLYIAFQGLQQPLPPGADFEDLTEERRALASAARELDAAIGRVLKELETQGLTEDTLVIVTGDNAVPGEAPSPHDPLAGRPGSVFGESQRVPLFLRWPGELPRGRPYPHPVSALDIGATIVAAAGARPADEQPLDGLNLVPLLDGTQPEPARRTLFWRSAGAQCARNGDWALVDVDAEKGVRLYNIARDPQMTNDLASALPDKRNALLSDLEGWERGLVPPAWE